MTQTDENDVDGDTPGDAATIDTGDVELLAQAIELVPIDSLLDYPGNPNEGDVGAIDESIEALGGKFYQVIFAQRSSGRILAGHSRTAELRARGSKVAPVVWLDVDDEQAARILVGDNEIPRNRSRVIPDALAAVLEDLRHTDVGIAGTGHDDDTLNKLLMSLNEAPLNPSRQLDDYEYRIIVECVSEEQQRTLIERFEGEGINVRALTS